MSTRLTKEFFIAALIRAVRTFAQTAVTMITVGQAFMDVNWLNVISISFTAAIICILTAIAGGIPEGDNIGTLHIDTSKLDKDVYKIDVGKNLESLSGKKKVMLNINPNAQL